MNIPRLPKLLLLALGCALAARLIVFVAAASNDSPRRFFSVDSDVYWRVGDNVANHRLFTAGTPEQYAPEHRRPPVYPLFIAFFRTLHLGAASIIGVQLLLSFAICLVTVLYLYRLSPHDLRPAFIAGILLGLDVPSIVFANLVLTETLFSFLLLLGVLCFISYFESSRQSRLWLSAIFFGLCSLCRPISILFPAFLLLVFLVRRQFLTKRRLLHAALFLGIYVLTLSPWLLRNNAVFGYPFISSNGYDSLLFYSAAAVQSSVEGVSIYARREAMEKDFSREFGALSADPRNLKTINREKAKLAASIIKAHPAIYAKNYAKSVFHVLFVPTRSYIDLLIDASAAPTAIETWGEKTGGNIVARLLRATSPVTLLLCAFQAVLLLGLYFLIGRTLFTGIAPEHLTMAAVFILTISYFALMSGAPGVDARFRVPIVPFLTMLAALGFFNRPRERTSHD